MKLVSMKCEQGEQKPEVASMSSKSSEYPYGLKLYIDHKSLEKLGLEELPEVGKKLKIEAVVEVCDVSMNDSQLYGENKSMGLQIVEMGIKGKSAEKEEGGVKVGGEMKPDKMYPIRTIE